MTRVCVDGAVSELDNPKMQLKEVVQNILSTLPKDRVVTEIMLDGANVVQHSELDVFSSTLGKVREVRIRTSDKKIWESNGLDMALSRLEKIQRSLLKASEYFRDDNLSEANSFFARCLDGLERFLETMMITKAVRQLDYEKVIVEGYSLLQIEHQFSMILKSILSYQERKDFNSIAEKIEYELLPNLCFWNKAIHSIKMASLSNA